MHVFSVQFHFFDIKMHPIVFEVLILEQDLIDEHMARINDFES